MIFVGILLIALLYMHLMLHLQLPVIILFHCLAKLAGWLGEPMINGNVIFQKGGWNEMIIPTDNEIENVQDE